MTRSARRRWVIVGALVALAVMGWWLRARDDVASPSAADPAARDAASPDADARSPAPPGRRARAGDSSAEAQEGPTSAFRTFRVHVLGPGDRPVPGVPLRHDNARHAYDKSASAELVAYTAQAGTSRPVVVVLEIAKPPQGD